MGDEVEILSGLGLSRQEAYIYVAALELGFSSISDIAKKAGIKRPTAYYVIEELIKKQLISKAPKGRRTFYLAEAPHKLLANLRGQEEKLVGILPNLETLQKAAPNKPQIRFYEGKEGLRTIYREIFSTHRKMIAVASMEKIYKVFSPEENAEFFELLRKERGQIYDLLEDSPQARQYSKAEYRRGLGRVKFLPENFRIGTDMLVAGDKVAMISFSAMVGSIIENKEIAETQRQLLEFLWGKC